MKYRKKSIVIEAMQWFKIGDHPEGEGKVVRYRTPNQYVQTQCQKCGATLHTHGFIDTLEGGHIVCPGDWIITGVKGETYPCRADIFEQTYDAEPDKEGGIMPLTTERRAEFVYEAARLAATHAKAPIIPVPWARARAAFKYQFLEVILRQCSDLRSTSPEELHEDWVQDHYAQLGKLEQDKDSVFVALCDIARLWIYEPEPDK